MNDQSQQPPQLSSRRPAPGVEALKQALRQVRRLVIFLIGITVVLIGVIMFFTPGPAIVVIPLGLGILAIEFAWARILLRRFRDRAEKLGQDVADRFRKDDSDSPGS